MNNNDERDYAEEAFNQRLLREEDLPPGAVPITWDYDVPVTPPGARIMDPLDVTCIQCDAFMGTPCTLVGWRDEPLLDEAGEPTFHIQRTRVEWVEDWHWPEPPYDEDTPPIAIVPDTRPCGRCFEIYTGEWTSNWRLWPHRYVIETFTTQLGFDPTTAYRLACGHRTIDL